MAGSGTTRVEAGDARASEMDGHDLGQRIGRNRKAPREEEPAEGTRAERRRPDMQPTRAENRVGVVFVPVEADRVAGSRQRAPEGHDEVCRTLREGKVRVAREIIRTTTGRLDKSFT